MRSPGLRTLSLSAALFFSLTAAPLCLAADNELTPEEEAAGWQLLFNGKDHTGWKCNNGQEIATPVEDGCLLPYKSGGYIINYDKPFGDFTLKCDVRMDKPTCNSGIFFRVSDLADPVQSGFEAQVASHALSPYQAMGAIYDFVKAAKKPEKETLWDWHQYEVTCRGPIITVTVDGEKISEMNCDEFTEPGQRPDGSKNKFSKAGKDFARSGYLGFQDHGAKCWYKNVKLLELKPE
ncbi:MAG: DUF1080 domain-containing protein [Pirellulales bacterium]|nr:DUF1080 domain-containing protein [Pirellulales bacterium]